MRTHTCSSDDCGRGGKLTRGMCAKCYQHWLNHTPKELRGPAPRFAVQFWDRVTKTHEYGCWLWTGPTDEGGYGRWKKSLAHRHSWQEANGPIPDGKWILHHCDNPPCVNPAHLYPGTVVENVRDMVTRGRGYVPPRKTHCLNGHALEGGNLSVVNNGGYRVYRCRRCGNARRTELQRQARRARGLLKTPLSVHEKALIRALCGDGMPKREVAVEVGRSVWAVYKVMAEVKA